MQKLPDAQFALRDLIVEHASPDALKPHQNNPRRHTKKQIRQIANSIKFFGWTNPVLVDANNRIIAGHGRVEAAKSLGMPSVPILKIEGLSDAEIRAYVIADNKLAENAGWDRDLLAIELQGLLELDLDFDLTITGFAMGEIDLLIGDLGEDDDADLLPYIDASVPSITQLGDLWQVGRHRLLCADASKRNSFDQLMASEVADMVFTDPPYNVPIDGHACGHGTVKHGDFAMAVGEMNEAEFVGFLSNVFGSLVAHSRDGAIHFVCMDWRHIFELLTAGRGVYRELKNLCVWAKTNGGMGSLYRSAHEFVAVFKHGTAAHINNIELGRHGRNRTNVWSYAGMNSFGAERDEALQAHPTVKPVGLVQDAILDCSNRGDIVLDPFVGSGTTLIAAERAGRRAFGLELEPRYVDVALRRFRKFTGVEPVHAKSGVAFSEVESTASLLAARTPAAPQADEDKAASHE
jgi:DNA modification methylase